MLGALGAAYPGLINDTTIDPAFMGLDFDTLRQLALYGLNSSHFDLGPLQALSPGQYRYLCTRNNAFSNRSQKGLLIVNPNAAWSGLGQAGIVTPPPIVSRTGVAWTTSGKAKLAQAYFNGTLLVPGSVNIVDAPEAGGDDWFLVNPPVTALGVNPQDLWLEADRPQTGNFFMKGKLEWKLNPADQAQEIIPNSNFYASQNKFAVVSGGYYRSTAVPNSAMIAGITLGCLGLGAIFVYLYWKVRVEPVGGWKIFCQRNTGRGKGGADAAESSAQYSAELVPQGATSSSSGAGKV